MGLRGVLTNREEVNEKGDDRKEEHQSPEFPDFDLEWSHSEAGRQKLFSNASHCDRKPIQWS